MSALDIPTDLDAAITAAFAANGAFATAFPNGKFIARDQRGKLRTTFWRVQSDYPQMRLSVTVDTAQRPQMVFAQNSTSYTNATVDTPIPCNAVASIAIIHQSIATEDHYVLESLVRSSLMAQWPKLGKQYVTGFSITERRREEDSERTKHTPRTVTEMTVNLTMRPMLSQLVG